MCNYKILIKFKLIFLFFFIFNFALADNHNLNEVLKLIQKDLKTLEKAVYSGSLQNNSNNQTNLNENSEDVLTRHLLKLSEIESQFQALTNKFEEINFKVDKLSSRLSKIQADNQLRFQNLENGTEIGLDKKKKLTSKSGDLSENDLPGSSQPQDLGSISYADTATNETQQQTQSIDSTSTIVTENFESEEKLLPDGNPAKQYEFATLQIQLRHQ